MAYTTAQVGVINRSLQLVGTRTSVTTTEMNSLSTNEAIQSDLIYTTTVDWCHAMLNWNFARKTAVLTQTKAVDVSGNWSSTSPAPPWLYEYLLPSDFIRALYLTNTDKNATNFLGEPQRFVIATDTITATQQEVLLCNQSVAILNYISRVSDPALWPSFFDRFVVTVMAKILSYVLTGEKERSMFLEDLSVAHFTAAEAVNRAEGLIVDDHTPEWIQALGIPYPYRRYNDMRPMQQEQPKDKGGKQ